MALGELETANKSLAIRDLPPPSNPNEPEEIKMQEKDAFVMSSTTGQMNEAYDRLRGIDYLASQSSLLTDLTGGIKIGGNFITKPENKVNEAMKGYYLLTYSPPAGTFGEIRKYHKIKINVKKPDIEVHSRKGFTGFPEPEETSTIDPLWAAIYSPFKNSDLQVSLSSGYIHDPQKGYLIRSWLHLNPVCITSDIEGFVQDRSNYHYQFRIREENLQWVKEHGIRFSLFLPIKKPGDYYVRAVVKDSVSGKVGSSYQAVQIPDVKKRSLTLSDIFVINSEESVAWLKSGIAEDISQKQIEPVLKRDASRSPALREYAPGDSFEYAAMVYNAKRDQLPGLEQQIILYKDGAEFTRTEAKPITSGDGADGNRIFIREKLFLNDAYQEGDYVLQLLVRDKRAKNSITAGTLSFRVAPK